MMKWSTFLSGLIVGAVIALLFAYRKQLGDLWHNRKSVGAAAQTVEGVDQTIKGLRSLAGAFRGN